MALNMAAQNWYSNVLVTTDLAALSIDEELQLLSHDRRRRAIEYVEAAPGPVDIDELAAHVAAETAEKTEEELTEDEKRRMLIELHHNHLPKLADHGILTYDQASGTISSE